MADSELYAAKLESLQKFIPFLNNMINELKNKGNRENQLNKMQSLHSMITDKKKRLKLETLHKCEEVLNSLYYKVNPQLRIVKDDSMEISPASPLSTPRSPSPLREFVPPTKPVTIPTEKVSTPEDRFRSGIEQIKKIDVYSSAGESLLKKDTKPSVPRPPEISRMPISLDDLKNLEDDVRDKMNSEKLTTKSMDELNSMRDQLSLQLKVDTINSTMSPKEKHISDVNTTVRNSLNLTKKLINPPGKQKTQDTEKKSSEDRHRESPNTKKDTKYKEEGRSRSKEDVTKNKSVKTADSLFGNVLSTLDAKILEETKKLKKAERRNSKERSSTETKDDKKADEKKKSKSDKHSSSPNKRDDKKKDKAKHRPETEHKEEKKTVASEDKTEKEKKENQKDNSVSFKDDEKDSDSGSDKTIILMNDRVDRSLNAKNLKPDNYSDLKVVQNNEKLNVHTTQSDSQNNIEMKEETKQIQMLKRLADKYNPKPKKSNTAEIIDLEVDEIIDQNMKISPIKPSNVLQKIPEPMPPPASLVRLTMEEKKVELPPILQNIFRSTQASTLPANPMPLTSSSSFFNNTGIKNHLASPPNQPMHSPQGHIMSPPGLNNMPLLTKPDLLPLSKDPRLGLESPRPDFNYEYPRLDNYRPNLFGMNQLHHIPQGMARPNIYQQQYPDQHAFQNDPVVFSQYNANPNHFSRYPHNNMAHGVFNNQGPPLLQPEVGGYYEEKPYMDPSWNNQVWRQNRDPRSYREYKEMKEREIKDPRLAREFAETGRDPRIARDFRETEREPIDNRDEEQPEYRNDTVGSRDPRRYRDKWDPRDNARDPKGFSRDPREFSRARSATRLNESDARPPRSQSRPREFNRERRRSPSRGQPPQNRETKPDSEENKRKDRKSSPSRYDSRFDKVYSQTGEGRVCDEETFTSPLDSLYTGKSDGRTGKGYGIQSFKIPKKKKPDPLPPPEIVKPVKSEVEVGQENGQIETTETDKHDFEASESETMEPAPQKDSDSVPEEEIIDSKASVKKQSPKKPNASAVKNKAFKRILTVNDKENESEENDEAENITEEKPCIDHAKAEEEDVGPVTRRRSVRRSVRKSKSQSEQMDANEKTSEEITPKKTVAQRKVIKTRSRSRKSKSFTLDDDDTDTSKPDGTVRDEQQETDTSKPDGTVRDEQQASEADNELLQSFKSTYEIECELRETSRNVEETWGDSKIRIKAERREEPIYVAHRIIQSSTDNDDSPPVLQMQCGEEPEEPKPMCIVATKTQTIEPVNNIETIAVQQKAVADSKTPSEVENKTSTDVECKTSTEKQDDEPSEKNILAHFFENLLKSRNKRDKKTALYSLIETFSDTFSEKELKKITKIIKTDDDAQSSSSDEEDSKKKDKKIESTPAVIEQTETQPQPEEKPPDVTNNENADLKNENEDSSAIPETSLSTDADKSIVDVEDPVVVSVGERIKSRKRNTSNPRQRKTKTELDLLHEDIQEMFIRDGVLTATGKRMCRILKDDPNALSPTKSSQASVTSSSIPSPKDEPKKIRKKPGPKPKQKPQEDTDSNSLKTIKVVISKMPDHVMKEKRHLRSTTNADSHLEDENEFDSDVSSAFDRELAGMSEYESSDNETSKSQGSDNPKPRKRRSKSAWASGIIKKHKKKSLPPKEDVEEPEQDVATFGPSDLDKFVPDKDYYQTEKSQMSCKICDFKGFYITIHYKTAHPDSEVLCSRLAPDVADQSVRDYLENSQKYEHIQSKKTIKTEYSCKMCDLSTKTLSYFFYEHVTTHTGEFRYHCGICDFLSSTTKGLNKHIATKHPGEENKERKVVDAYSYPVVFGYLCSECNYVQLTKKNVDDHVNIFHLGDKPRIYKINMSRTFDPVLDSMVVLDTEFRDTPPPTPVPTEEEQKEPEMPVLKKVDGKKKPGPKPKKAPELTVTEESKFGVKKQKPCPKSKKLNASVEQPTIRKKPGPKSKTMVSTENSETIEPPEPINLKELDSSKEPDTPKEITEPEVPENNRTMKSPRARSVRQKRKTLTESTDEEGPSTDTSDCSRDVNEVRSVKRCDKRLLEDNLLKDVIVEGRGRAAKEKASAKLKTLMEENEALKRKPAGKNKSQSDKEDVAEHGVSSEKSSVSSEKSGVSSEKSGESPVKKKDEPNMNIFTCVTDIQQEEKKIEEERLKKMEELNKTIGSRISKLDFTDKLSTRLKDDIQQIKEEPQGGEEQPSEVQASTSAPVDVLHSVHEPEPEIERMPAHDLLDQRPTKKPVLEEDTPLPNTDLSFAQNKSNPMITSMIEKLQGKLNETPNSPPSNFDTFSSGDDDSQSSTVIIPPVPIDSETVAGLITASKFEDGIVFSCNVDQCSFSNNNKDVFREHCKFSHVHRQEITLCDKCGITLSPTPDTTLLENLFDHVTDRHLFTAPAPAPEPAPAPVTAPPIKLRRLSGDKLSLKCDDDIDEQPPIVKAEEQDNVQTASLEISADCPFPFKIADVVSLAESESDELNRVPSLTSFSDHQPPPLTLLSNKPSLPQSLMVKEAKLSAIELKKPRKTAKAMAKFIRCAGDLYKCPHYYCMYSTNFRDFLERHLKAHKLDQDQMIPCVYCDMKTPWEHVPMHIDIRHAQCNFVCSHCLYRAVLKEYVIIHQEISHPLTQCNVITLPPFKLQNKYSVAESKGDQKSLCEPYRCIEAGYLYLFENEFARHLSMNHHPGVIGCAYPGCTANMPAADMVAHWNKAHSVCKFQCGFCKTNCTELQNIYTHFAQCHPDRTPDVLYRELAQLKDNEYLYYSVKAFSLLRHISTPESIKQFEFSTEAKKVTISTPEENKTTATLTQQSSEVIENSGKPAQVSLLKKPTVTYKPKSPTKSNNVQYLISPQTPHPNHFTLVVSTNPSTISPVNSVGIPTTSNTMTTVACAGAQTKTSSASEQVLGIVNVVPDNILNLQPLVKTSPQKTVSSNQFITTPDPVVRDRVVEVSIPEIAPVEHIELAPDPNASANTTQQSDSETDPLSIDTAVPSLSMTSDEESEASTSSSKTSSSKMKGLKGYDLFRCSSCSLSFANLNGFRAHVSSSVTCKWPGVKPYKCVHCDRFMKNVVSLVEHVKTHGVPRFSCSLCSEKIATNFQIKSHMKVRHNINQMTYIPLDPLKNDLNADEFMVRPVQKNAPTETEKAPIETGSTDELVFTPDQINDIPYRQIFNQTVRCGLCHYSNKVRINIIRHLQMHLDEQQVPDSAPVNPVPCLEKNEKMFDKMTNLAASSFDGGRMGGGKKDKEESSIPDYVPSQCRYVCCARGCSYICPEEGNLKHHLTALHSDETELTCAHCKANVEPADADALIKHLKLHGLHLYKCHYCKFVHHLKHKVEKHVSDSHLDVAVKVITIRYMDSEPSFDTSITFNYTPSPGPSKLKPWLCCMCKYRCATDTDIKAHISSKHDIDFQFKCTLCNYKSDEKDTFKTHFKEKHPNNVLDIIYVYRKEEEEQKDEMAEPFDTTPLWLRDKPRVRHIRGILFDEIVSQPTKTPKKPQKAFSTTPKSIPPSPRAASPQPSTSAMSSPARSQTTPADSPVTVSKGLLDCIEAVVNGTAESLKKPPPADPIISQQFVDDINKAIPPVDEINEVRDDTVIVIPDDDDGEQNLVKPDSKKEPKVQEKGVKRKPSTFFGPLSKRPVKQVEDEVIDLDADDVVQNKQADFLQLQFGDFGMPHNKQLKCPKCNLFKTKRINDFIFHIYRDVKVFRFKCNLCQDESITYKYMKEHILQHGAHVEQTNILKLPPNQDLETWIQMVIQHQCSIILTNFPNMGQKDSNMGEDQSSVDAALYVHQCTQCSKRFKTFPHLCEHLLVHWAEKPYGCGYCNYEEFTTKSINVHQQSCHKNLEMLVKTRAPTVDEATNSSDREHQKRTGSEIPYVQVNKKPKPDNIPVIKTENSLEANKNTANDVIQPSEPVAPNREPSQNSKEIFACDYCPYVANTIALTKSHLACVHSHSPIKLHTIKNDSCVKIEDYVACNQCLFVSDELSTRQHFDEMHQGLVFALFKIMCTTCENRYYSLNNFKIHHGRAHPGTQVRFRYVGNKGKVVTLSSLGDRKKLKRYKCTMCFFESINLTSSGIKTHIKSHFKPYQCNACNNTYRFSWEIKSHCIKEHSDTSVIVFNHHMSDQHAMILSEIIKNAEEIEPPTTNTARKSTSAPFIRTASEEEEEGFSYYGTTPEPIDASKINAVAEMKDGYIYTTVDKLQQIYNLNPIVEVDNCNLTIDLSKVFSQNEENRTVTEDETDVIRIE